MKLRHRLFALGLTLSFCGIACDDSPSRDVVATESTAEQEDSDEVAPFGFRASQTPREAERELAPLRARADAAFDDLLRADEPDHSGTPGAKQRYDNRIGPQPWPMDLPDRWPIPDQGQLLAVTRAGDAERLLLVDLPGRPELAFASYRDVLRERGFEVEIPTRLPERAQHALYARRGEEHAMLRFFARADATRLEILLLRRSAS